MKYIFQVIVAGIMLVLAACTGNHIISDTRVREKIRKDYLERKILAGNREKDLFAFESMKIEPEEREAMEFLYAYMPLSDLADYDGGFFLGNSRIALRAIKERSWGKAIPGNIFLHYVLPVRVNNENLDSFRIKYYDEISSRIKELDAKSAALEINHWCHEKVSYQPSDDRTSAPLSTMLSARGRCGEESTFTVAALRTAGLPARQVYTPRWAHSDDNHAWVEVWIDGTWYYMGACEPEAVLDRGWFTEPAKRAMLIDTKSFGAPFGEPGVLLSHRNYSLVNNLSKYAVTKTIYVRTLTADGKPAEKSSVEFQLYNYSEFYPLATIMTGSDGLCHFETGLGDLLIWAHKGNDFSFRKISVSETDTLNLVLDRKPEESAYYEFNLGVPPVMKVSEGPSADLINRNNERLEAENRIRKEYTDTWMNPRQASAYAVTKGIDTTCFKDIIARSMGNFRTITKFISATAPGDMPLAIRLLSLISDKDLRDIKPGVLTDHLKNSVRYNKQEQGYNESVYNSYVLNPRIANEIIAPWRGYLLESVPSDIRKEAVTNPGVYIKYVTEKITLNDTDNYYRTPITPVGVSKLGISDSFSRDIFFVAICRASGIPARLEPGSNKPQYFWTGTWHDVSFRKDDDLSEPRGFIKFSSSEKEPVPEYYIHFTLAKFENGRYNTLEYDYNRRITDFRDELALTPGYYMLVTGNRVSDSRILSSITFFKLSENEHRIINVKLRKQDETSEVLGKLSIDSKIRMPDGSLKGIRELAEKGLVISWIEPDREPTKHILNDLPLLKADFDRWGGYFVFLSEPSTTVADIESFKKMNLPVKSIFGYDNNSDILKQLCGGISCTNVRFPVVIVAASNGDVLFKSEGYRIGIGEQILKKVH